MPGPLFFSATVAVRECLRKNAYVYSTDVLSNIRAESRRVVHTTSTGSVCVLADLDTTVYFRDHVLVQCRGAHTRI